MFSTFMSQKKVAKLITRECGIRSKRLQLSPKYYKTASRLIFSQYCCLTLSLKYTVFMYMNGVCMCLCMNFGGWKGVGGMCVRKRFVLGCVYINRVFICTCVMHLKLSNIFVNNTCMHVRLCRCECLTAVLPSVSRAGST